jgi:ribose transport system substrate-binding protein
MNMKLGKWMLGLGLLVALAGCQPSGGGASASGPGTAPAAGKKFKLGVSLPSASHGWTAGTIWWAEEVKKMYPDVDITIVTADGPEKQISDIETLMTQNVDGLVVLATESAPLTPVAKQVKERGILLVNVDRGFTEPGIADIFLEGDNTAFGQKSAEYIVKKLNGQGNIVILEGIPSTVNTARVDAAMEVFKANPGIKVLAQQSGKWNKADSLKVMESILPKFPKIDAVWSSDDDMSLGAEQAIREAGRQDEMWMLGGGGMKEIVKKIMDGDKMYPATVTYPPSMVGLAVHQAVATLRGGKDNVLRFTPKRLVMDVEVVTPENAKNFYFENSKY